MSEWVDKVLSLKRGSSQDDHTNVMGGEGGAGGGEEGLPHHWGYRRVTRDHVARAAVSDNWLCIHT